MALTARLALSVALLAATAGVVPAQPGPDAGVPDAVAPDAAPPPTFEPPVALGATEVVAPPGAPALTADVVVTVKLRVDITGAVEAVELVTAPQPPFDDAVVAAARQFRFQPGTYGGAPVPVEITFTHTFTAPPPPPPPPADHGPARTAVLRGRLIELGTRAPVDSATVIAVVDGRTYAVDADPRGRFSLELPPGAAAIAVHAPAHLAFRQAETLAEHQALAVTYYVERDRYDPYEIVIVDEPRREEVSRVTLRGPELRQVPGTFGDPFRVVQALPGVASVVSLLPFPVIRGASPASTGFLIDGIRVPLLFHLMSGPSVIHPEFIDEIQFFPGGAPAPYGGYTGGIVDGRTARSDRALVDVDANLLQVGGLVRRPWRDVTVTAAARYGYPGLLLSLASSEASLSYWDYQLRVDGGTKATGWTVFAFGANDQLDTVAADADPADPTPPLEPSLILDFHRLDLRGHLTRGRLEASARAIGGYDHTFSQGTDFEVWRATTELRARWKAHATVELAAGLDGTARRLTQGAGADAADSPLAAITADLSTASVGAGFVEALWRPTPAWLVRPGVRADLLHDRSATRGAVDPRLTVRYRVGERALPDVAPGSDDAAVWLKASAGVYHQPPRFVLPLPGLDEMPLRYGLLRAYQSSLGIEAPLGGGFQLSTEGYFNYLDPTIFDLSINAASVGTDAQGTLIPTEVVEGMDRGEVLIERLTRPQLGRAYGVEVLLRRQAGDGLFGWVSYTLSRAERSRDGVWAPYDFDRRHLINVVAGLPLPRNWDVGVRAQYQSGLPATTTAGYNTARADGYLRFDVRVDKRAVWRDWLLDFYVDVTNVALLPEEVTPGNKLRYVLPTVGVRGRI